MRKTKRQMADEIEILHAQLKTARAEEHEHTAVRDERDALAARVREVEAQLVSLTDELGDRAVGLSQERAMGRVLRDEHAERGSRIEALQADLEAATAESERLRVLADAERGQAEQLRKRVASLSGSVAAGNSKVYELLEAVRRLADACEP